MTPIKYLSIACAFAISANAVELEPITVTTVGLGQEQSIDDVQASVEVIDQKTIQSTSARSLPQVLNEALGITIQDPGSTSEISMRGFNTNHTLILVDGLRISGKYGSSDLSTISLDNVERIEIVRGPMSVLYGSDAVAGLINVITKKEASKDSMKASILGGVADNGQRDTYIASLSGTIGGENITHHYSVELREKDEYRYDKTSTNTDLKNESRQFFNYSNTIKIDDQNMLSTKLDYAKQDDDGIHTTGAKVYEKENRYQAALIHNYTAQNYLVDTNLAYSYSDTKVDRAGGLETTDYRQTEFNSYFRHFTTDKMTNIIGVGYKHEEIDVSIYTKNASRDNYNILYQNDYELMENLTSSIGIRYDDFSDFGSTTNLKASLAYKYNDFKFRASYGEAFKAPEFTNMYSYFFRSSTRPVPPTFALHTFNYDIYGNENLKPEESKTHEFAINYTKNNFSFDIIHHRSKLNNLIESYTVSSTTVGSTTDYLVSYQNVANASINGTEISLRYQFDNGFGAKLGWEYLDTKDETTGERLTGSAKSTLKANLSYLWNDLSIYLNIKKYNDYYGTNEARTNVNSDYTVADLKLNYKVKDNLEWFAGVDNIQNKLMPFNMTSRGTPNDPGERFFYTGMNFTF